MIVPVESLASLLAAFDPAALDAAAGVLAMAGPGNGNGSGDQQTQLQTWIFILAGLALLPFVLTMITSFAKLVIVFGIIRQALGTQQIPPNTVVTGLALILTVHVMWPVAEAAWQGYEQASAETSGSLDAQVNAAIAPIAGFLERHASPDNRALFLSLREELRATNAESVGSAGGASAGDGDGASAEADGEVGAEVDAEVGAEAGADAGTDAENPAVASDSTADPGDRDRFGLSAATRDRLVETLTIHTPAFVLTELTEAFQVGFLIFVPFLVLDLVVANVLLAMGMHMLSPQTISLPLKILLFVLVDGWGLILRGLVLGYATGGG